MLELKPDPPYAKKRRTKCPKRPHKCQKRPATQRTCCAAHDKVLRARALRLNKKRKRKEKKKKKKKRGVREETYSLPKEPYISRGPG